MTAGERLAFLSGLTTRSAGAHLASLAAGATAGARMVARSGLGVATAVQHLLAGVVAAASFSWGLFRSPFRSPFRLADRPAAWASGASAGTGIAYMQPLIRPP